MNTNKITVIAAALAVGGCIAPDLPPMNGTAADPQVRGSSRTPRNLLVRDQTTRAIEKQLSATESTAASAEKMQHGMGNMPGMQQNPPPQSQHSTTPAPSGPSTAPASSGNTAIGDYYTCVMHPEIHSDKPGNCPICGMQLVKKERER